MARAPLRKGMGGARKTLLSFYAANRPPRGNEVRALNAMRLFLYNGYA